MDVGTAYEPAVLTTIFQEDNKRPAVSREFVHGQQHMIECDRPDKRAGALASNSLNTQPTLTYPFSRFQRKTTKNKPMMTRQAAWLF